VPRWASRLAVSGVRYVPLAVRRENDMNLLPLAAVWLRGSRDPLRDELLATLQSRLARYVSEA